MMECVIYRWKGLENTFQMVYYTPLNSENFSCKLKNKFDAKIKHIGTSGDVRARTLRDQFTSWEHLVPFGILIQCAIGSFFQSYRMINSIAAAEINTFFKILI